MLEATILPTPPPTTPPRSTTAWAMLRADKIHVWSLRETPRMVMVNCLIQDAATKVTSGWTDAQVQTMFDAYCAQRGVSLVRVAVTEAPETAA